MKTFIVTARRTIVVDQQAVVSVEAEDMQANTTPLDVVPEDAWRNHDIRHVQGASVVSVLEYDDPQMRFEFVTGAVPAKGDAN